MTEWNPSRYHERAALQKWLAEKSLADLALSGAEHVLDVGCGDGRITAEIAARVPHGSVIGIDPSTAMIGYARRHFVADFDNLRFEVGDAAGLRYQEEFDLVVSFNALHWVTDQEAALRCIREALRPAARAVLQFVSQGERRPLEDVLEETREDPRWSRYFAGFRRPYVHVPPDEYRRLAERCGLRVEHLDVAFQAWDFGSPAAFAQFGEVTFVEWTQRIPAGEQAAFIGEVLDRYRRLGDGSAADAAVFHFYQTRIALQRP